MPDLPNGMLEMIAVVLFCAVAVTFVHQKVGAAPVGEVEHVVVASQLSGTDRNPAELAIKDMLLHD
jgi:hypothetical protein